MESLSTKFDDITVSYTARNEAEAAATVVFIHGFPFDRSIWSRQIESLPSKINCLAYDIRGFGSSSPGHSFYSIDLFARDLLRLIDMLGITDCVLCGISMGGYVALRAMEISKKNIKGLILCDTNCVADSDEGKIKRFNAIEQIVSGSKDEFTSAFIQNVFSENTLKSKPETVSFLRELIMGTPDSTICSTLLALASRTDTSKLLPDIGVPTLVIRGEHDKLMSDEQSRQLASIPHSEMITIRDSGHLPILENREDFNSALNNFLSKHFLS